jgi:GNAT superfamily N-acetyltransferase
MNDTTIRLATPEDLTALVALSTAFAAERGLAPPHSADDLMRRLFIAPGSRVLTARRGAEAVGHAVMRLDSDTGRAGFDLTELYVVPLHRGQGTGRRLIAAARALTEAEGQVRLRLRNLPGARGQALRLGEVSATPVYAA